MQNGVKYLQKTRESISECVRKHYESIQAALQKLPVLSEDSVTDWQKAATEKVVGDLLGGVEAIESSKASCGTLGFSQEETGNMITDAAWTSMREALLVVCCSTSIRITQSKAAKSMAPLAVKKACFDCTLPC